MSNENSLSPAQIDELLHMVEWAHGEISRLRSRDMIANTFHYEVLEAFKQWMIGKQKADEVARGWIEVNQDFVLAVSNALVKKQQDEKEMGVQSDA